MASAAPPPLHSRSSPAFERRQKIARRIAVGFLFLVGCLLVLSYRLDPLPRLSTPAEYLLSAAGFCLITFIGFMNEPLTVPARLQLRLYAAASLVGLVYAWVFTSLISSYWYGVISIVVISAVIKTIAARMIKAQHTKRK